MFPEPLLTGVDLRWVGFAFVGGLGVCDIAKRCPYNLPAVNLLPLACLVLRAVAATAIFVALVAGALAGQKDARNERPYIFLADYQLVQVRLLLLEVRRFH